MQHHRTGFVNATALGKRQQGGCSDFFFPLGFRIKQWVRAWGRDDQEDQEGLIVYGESGKNVVTGASQDARRNEGFLLLGQSNFPLTS